jgi:translation initiation factor 1
MADDNARTVYSTGPGGVCPRCGWPADNCRCSRTPARDANVLQRVVAKLRMEKKGRGGKTVTVVYDLPKNGDFLKSLARELKQACGTGGTVVENTVEIHGEQRDRIRAMLTKKGWTVKG